MRSYFGPFFCEATPLLILSFELELSAYKDCGYELENSLNITSPPAFTSPVWIWSGPGRFPTSSYPKYFFSFLFLDNGNFLIIKG